LVYVGLWVYRACGSVEVYGSMWVYVGLWIYGVCRYVGLYGYVGLLVYVGVWGVYGLLRAPRSLKVLLPG